MLLVTLIARVGDDGDSFFTAVRSFLTSVSS